jgi:acyl dehydratase
MTARTAQGPFFDELEVGQRFDHAPALTLTPGHASQHQAIVGDRLMLPLAHPMSAAVTRQGVLAHPALVWNVAIGQSTLATHHVKANLFYRGLVFHRAPMIGDTLITTTEVVGLRENQRKEGRHPTGLAALRIATVDQEGRSVLDFWRCAMLPLRDQERRTGHGDDLAAIGAAPSEEALVSLTSGWDLGAFPAPAGGIALEEGTEIEVDGGDVVSSAPELARLTLNVAKVHHDAEAGGDRRLVYGGHTIAVALAQVCRAIPGVVTVAGWDGCDHVGPVHEGDTLRSRVVVGPVRTQPQGGRLVDLRSLVTADGAAERAVLDWRFTAVLPD